MGWGSLCGQTDLTKSIIFPCTRHMVGKNPNRSIPNNVVVVLWNWMLNQNVKMSVYDAGYLFIVTSSFRREGQCFENSDLVFRLACSLVNSFPLQYWTKVTCFILLKCRKTTKLKELYIFAKRTTKELRVFTKLFGTTLLILTTYDKHFQFLEKGESLILYTSLLNWHN